MKKLTSILSGVITGLFLLVTPAMASKTQLAVNIPDGHNAQITSQTIKLNSDDDGSITFTGKASKDATITIEKHGGNNRHYKVQVNENGDFSKKINLFTSTKKCKFVITAKASDESKSHQDIFVVKNTAYVKPQADDESDSEDNESTTNNSGNASAASSSSTTENNGDMRTDNANGLIVGNARTKIYHTPDQQGYHMNSANAVYFHSEAEAQAAGYRKSLRIE